MRKIGRQKKNSSLGIGDFPRRDTYYRSLTQFMSFLAQLLNLPAYSMNPKDVDSILHIHLERGVILL